MTPGTTQPPGLLDAHHPWRPEPRPADRRGHGADLRDLDLRPAEPRRAQGLRICAQPEPDALCLRARRRRPGKRHAPASPSPRAWRRSRTVFELLDSGAHVVATDDIYGGTFRLFERVRKRSAGLQATFRRLHRSRRGRSGDPAGDARCSGSRRRPIRCCASSISRAWRRSPGASAADLRSADNTFCSPYIQRPLELGIDLVVHSTTKYLNGHSDMVGGCVVVGDNTDLADRLNSCRTPSAPISGPFDSFLALRGMKTLALRMERHSANGLTIADGWRRATDVRRVIYPGLAAIRSTRSPRRRCRPSAA